MTSTIAPANPDAPDGRWIEYAGGYSDMLAQRKGVEDERKRVEKAEKAKAQEAAGGKPAEFRLEGQGQALLQAEVRAGKPAEGNGKGREGDRRA